MPLNHNNEVTQSRFRSVSIANEKHRPLCFLRGNRGLFDTFISSCSRRRNCHRRDFEFNISIKSSAFTAGFSSAPFGAQGNVRFSEYTTKPKISRNIFGRVAASPTGTHSFRLLISDTIDRLSYPGELRPRAASALFLLRMLLPFTLDKF